MEKKKEFCSLVVEVCEIYQVLVSEKVSLREQESFGHSGALYMPNGQFAAELGEKKMVDMPTYSPTQG